MIDRVASIFAALIGAVINAVFGLLVAWVLARYSFPLKRIVDAAVDLPFALPTSVAGIALAGVVLVVLSRRESGAPPAAGAAVSRSAVGSARGVSG